MILWVLFFKLVAAAAAKSLQSCPTLCDPIGGSLSGFPHPWDSPGKNTGVSCHFLLQCMKVKSESEVAQLCLTLWPHGLQPTRLLRPWDFPGKSTSGATKTSYSSPLRQDPFEYFTNAQWIFSNLSLRNKHYFNIVWGSENVKYGIYIFFFPSIAFAQNFLPALCPLVHCEASKTALPIQYCRHFTHVLSFFKNMGLETHPCCLLRMSCIEASQIFGLEYILYEIHFVH